MSRAVGLTTCICSALLACLLFVSTVAAHALPLTSVPAAGAEVAVAPERVVVTFGEAPDPVLSRIEVLDVNGQGVTSGPTTGVAGDVHQLQVPLRPVASGVYTVAWRTVSAIDGHLASGSFAFGIDAPVPATGTGTLDAGDSGRLSTLAPLAVLGRWILFVGLGGLLGATFVAVMIMRRPSRVTLPMAGISWLVAVASTAMVLGSQMADAGVDLVDVMGTSLGAQVMERGIPLVIAAAALLVAVRRPPPGRSLLIVLAVTAAFAMLADVLASHAAASGDTSTAIIVQWLHFVAAAIWLGGLAALLLTLVAVRPDHGTQVTVGRFARTATVGLVLVAATGLLRAITEVGTIDALVSTDFGRLIIAKSLLLVLLAGLGAFNHFRNVPRATSDLHGLRRVGSIEVSVALVVLIVAAALVNLAPPSSVAASGAPSPGSPGAASPGASPAVSTPSSAVVVTGSDFGTSVRVTLTVSPGVAGFDTFTLDASDYDTGAPVAGGAVTLRFALPARPTIGGSRLDLSEVAAGRYQAAGGNVSLAGVWDVTATIGHDDTSVEVPMQLATAIPDQRVDVQTTAGLPTIYTVHLVAGGTLQVYADPGTTGPNELHATFFDAAGTEAAVTSATFRVGPDDAAAGQPGVDLTSRMLEPGHFVADTDLAPGGHRLVVTGSPSDGSYLAALIDLRIRP